MNKSTSMSSKLQNTPQENMNINLIPNTSIILYPLDLKKTCANISLFNLSRIQSHQDILFRALGQTAMENVASTRKGEITPLQSISTMLKTLHMEEENLGYAPFMLSFYVFNYNVHNDLVDYGTIANIMPLSISKRINAHWRKTSMQIIQLDQTFVPVIGELRDVIIQLSHHNRVHQCINIVVVDIS